jgi:hypothetical protein
MKITINPPGSKHEATLETDIIEITTDQPLDDYEAVMKVIRDVKWWGCQCGYSMPEPLQTCVKCGSPRQKQ